MIPIKNIYYMLSYSFRVLNEQGYKNVATEHFENIADLYAAILSKGISVQIKRGLGREYMQRTEGLSVLRGKLELNESLRTGSLQKKELVCSYDDFSVNSRLNRIIKSTAELLLKSDISKKRKNELKKLLVFFSDVDSIDLKKVSWNIQYNRNNQTYRMLVSVCYMVAKGLLQTTSDGNTKLMDFMDDQQMSRLYERFILEFYRRELPRLSASASQIKWQLDDGIDLLLPVMRTDIMLGYKEKVLIIDAKYYSQSMQIQHDIQKNRSGNLYQIFTYVKNKEAELSGRPHEVSGMLLYAKTDEEIYPDQSYHMSGNKISVCTLDLNCEFEKIKEQLIRLAKEHFGDEIEQ